MARQDLLSQTLSDLLAWLIVQPKGVAPAVLYDLWRPRGVTATTVSTGLRRKLVTVALDGAVSITDAGREAFAAQHGDAHAYHARRWPPLR